MDLADKNDKADEKTAEQLPATEDEQLVALFANRNELKRNLEQVREELEAKTAELEKLQARSGERDARLQGLEEMLADPERGQGAIIYYRLDAIWHYCKDELEKAAIELKEKLEKEEMQAHEEAFEMSKAENLEQLKKKSEQLDELLVDQRAQQSGLQEKMLALKKPWHFFKRKNLQQELDAMEEEMQPLLKKVEDCEREMEKVSATTAPAYKGLSILGKRNINCMLVAHAQYFYAHFMENDIVNMALLTQEKMPHETNFGDREECLALERPITEALVKLKNDTDRDAMVDKRHEFVFENAKYEKDNDTQPFGSAVGKIALSIGVAESAEVQVNVIDKNFFGVADLLFT